MTAKTWSRTGQFAGQIPSADEVAPRVARWSTYFRQHVTAIVRHYTSEAVTSFRPLHERHTTVAVITIRAFHVAIAADSAPRPTCAHCFYARDAVLARVLAMAQCLSLCLSVCLSLTSRCSIETHERIELVSRHRGHFGIAQSVCLSHGAAAYAISTLAVCNLATSGRQRCLGFTGF